MANGADVEITVDKPRQTPGNPKSVKVLALIRLVGIFGLDPRSGSVVAKKQAERLSVTTAPKRANLNRSFTAKYLWRACLWGATAAGAIALAVLSSRSDIGAQRVAALFSSSPASQAARPASPSFDARAETRRLAAAVQNLTTENSQLKSRLASVEQNMEDVTGSVRRQIQAVQAQTANAWPSGANPAPSTPAEIASLIAMQPPATAFGAPLPRAAKTPPEAATAMLPYGVDIGGALSIEVLRARWLGIRSAHRQLLEGLIPTVELRQAPRTKRIELRLVAGPLASSDAAERLCASLILYRLSCEPTPFDREDLPLQ